MLVPCICVNHPQSEGFVHSSSGDSFETLICSICRGTERVTIDFLERRTIGNEFKKKNVEAGKLERFTWRETANKLGIGFTELVNIYSGIETTTEAGKAVFLKLRQEYMQNRLPNNALLISFTSDFSDTSPSLFMKELDVRRRFSRVLAIDGFFTTSPKQSWITPVGARHTDFSVPALLNMIEASKFTRIFLSGDSRAISGIAFRLKYNSKAIPLEVNIVTDATGPEDDFTFSLEELNNNKINIIDMVDIDEELNTATKQAGAIS